MRQQTCGAGVLSRARGRTTCTMTYMECGSFCDPLPGLQRGARVSGVLDAFGLLAVAVYADPFVPRHVFSGRRDQRLTPSSIGRGAVGFTMLAWTYGSLRSWLLVPYALGPCRAKLDKIISPT